MAGEKPKKVTEATLKSVRTDRAYRAVFGQEGHRSEAQKLVWEDMEKRGFFLVPVHSPQKPPDVNLGLINEGKRRFHLGTIGKVESPALLTVPEQANQEIP